MSLETVVKSIYSIVWGLPLISVIICVGFYFSFRLKFPQIKHIKEAFKYVLNRDSSGSILGDISSFGALCTALSATLGTGNIVGIAVALTVGGPGTLFWIVISSFFSLATKYCEGFLAIKYRKVGSDGKIAGGPMYYIEKGLKSKLMAKLFAVFGIGVALIGIGTFAQTKSIAAIACSIGLPSYISGILIGVIVALVTFGGIHRISDVAEKIVPFMTILYIGTAIIILILKFDMIIPALKLIMRDAFEPQAVVGGGLGAALMHSIQTGICRGIFCHEASLGSAAIAAAAAKIDSPVKQGLVCMVGAFLSIIICVVTGLVLITTSKIDASGVIQFASSETSMTAHAFGAGLGAIHLGNCIVNISIILFAFTTIIGWNYYGEKCIQYIFHSKSAISIYRVLYIIFVVIGPFLEIKTAFVIADIVIGLMAIPNVLSLIAMRGEITKETREFFKDKTHDFEEYI